MTDVYVVRFPEGTAKVQITNGGGGTPFWSSDSRELFFAAPPGALRALPVSHPTGAGFWPSGSLRLKPRRKW